MTTIISDRTLKFKEVVTLWDALELRRLRNECRLFMTHDTSKIGIWQQIQWFYKTYRKWSKTGQAKAYLAYYPVGDYYEVVVGYGLIRNLKTIPVLSGGLGERSRGMGFGRQLFAFLVKECKKKVVVLDVLATNTSAIKLYKKLGFSETHREDGIIYMRYYQ